MYTPSVARWKYQRRLCGTSDPGITDTVYVSDAMSRGARRHSLRSSRANALRF